MFFIENTILYSRTKFLIAHRTPWAHPNLVPISCQSRSNLFNLVPISCQSRSNLAQISSKSHLNLLPISSRIGPGPIGPGPWANGPAANSGRDWNEIWKIFGQDWNDIGTRVARDSDEPGGSYLLSKTWFY